MAKAHPAVDLQQPGALGRLELGGRDPEALRRSPQERRIAERLRRGHQQQLPRLRRQVLKSLQESLLHPALERYRDRQPEPARQLCGRQSPR